MTEQEKMEKVIKGLECCTKKACIYKDTEKECPYSELCGEYEDSFEDCTTALSKDALALLKVQEPRVMTSAEVETWLMIDRVDRAPIVVEVRDRFIAWIVGDEYYDLPECNLSGEFYNKTWRCWTSCPDQATREAIPWERLN